MTFVNCDEARQRKSSIRTSEEETNMKAGQPIGETMTSIFMQLTTRRRSATILLLIITIALMISAFGSAAVPIAVKR